MNLVHSDAGGKVEHILTWVMFEIYLYNAHQHYSRLLNKRGGSNNLTRNKIIRSCGVKMGSSLHFPYIKSYFLV